MEAQAKRPLKVTPATIMILGESISICLDQGANDAQFDFLVNDYRLAGHGKGLIRACVAFLGRSEADLERAFAKEPRIYTAEERAPVWNLDYDQYRRLGLRFSGCAEKKRYT